MIRPKSNYWFSSVKSKFGPNSANSANSVLFVLAFERIGIAIMEMVRIEIPVIAYYVTSKHSLKTYFKHLTNETQSKLSFTFKLLSLIPSFTALLIFSYMNDINYVNEITYVIK